MGEGGGGEGHFCITYVQHTRRAACPAQRIIEGIDENATQIRTGQFFFVFFCLLWRKNVPHSVLVVFLVVVVVVV